MAQPLVVDLLSAVESADVCVLYEYTHTHKHAPTHTHSYVLTYMYAYIYIYVCVHTNGAVSRRLVPATDFPAVCVCIICIHTHAHKRTHTRTHTFICGDIYICTYVYIRIYK